MGFNNLNVLYDELPYHTETGSLMPAELWDRTLVVGENMDQKKQLEPPIEDDSYDGGKYDHDETSADFSVEETNAKEVKPA